MSQFQNVPLCPISASPLSGIYALLRQAQILILEILNVFLWLKFSPSLILNPDVIGKHFETASHDSVFEWVIVWYFRHKYCVTNEKCDK